jgi:DNA modification methylase
MTKIMTYEILVGDNRELLKTLPDSSVQTVITSPPYWGLRDYGTANWIGGDPECKHYRDNKVSESTTTGHTRHTSGIGDGIYKDVCKICGAVREDEQIGLEKTPEEYVEELCKVFDEVWRVLKDDGILWLNIGDTYVGTGSKGDLKDPKYSDGRNAQGVALNGKVSGLKTKELIGVPWRVAFALQARGWYLRQDIIWAKNNPMPESVRDRCTKSHEYIFMMTKQPKYFFDSLGIREEAVTPAGTKGAKGSAERSGTEKVNSRPTEYAVYTGYRNKRDVWNVNTKPYKEAHFATYPPELIEPCVLAGTSEYGECAECGKAWVRAEESWEKQCKCETTEVVPQTVLDPFSGAGTTGLVALKNGRRYLGLELNPEYAELSRGRIEKDLTTPAKPKRAKKVTTEVSELNTLF